MVSTPKAVANQLRTVMRDKSTAMRRVVLAGERIAKQEAPVKRGGLRRSITSRVEQGGDRGVIGTNLVYARPVHEGTGARIIKPTTKKALYWKGAKHPVKSVRHPGTRPNPFFIRTRDKLRPVAERELTAWGKGQLGRVG